MQFSVAKLFFYCFTLQEVGLPSNILDLMTLCWSSDPSDRPSAAEIVSFLSRVEFSRLCNAVMLDEDHQDVICCCSAPRPLAFGDQKMGKKTVCIHCNVM